MDQERSEIRQVEDARRRVADDVRSVAQNANVVDRAKENVRGRIDDVKESVSDRVSGIRDTMQHSVQDMTGRMQSMRPNMSLSFDNPVAMLLGGLAVGFLVGLLLPVSRFESERLGPVAEDMRGRVEQARTEVVRRGGEVIKETIEAARESAGNSIREQTRDMGMGGDSTPLL